MAAYARRVRRLTVRAPSDAVARRVAIQIEDALQTASLPGGDSARLVVIRRLHLPRIPIGTSSAFLAVAIEQRLWELGSAAVHALNPAAAAANSVYFNDAAEAHALLAARLAAGREAAEWFWTAAIPPVRNHSDRKSALREVFQSICELDGALIVAGRLVRDLAATGGADALCGVWRAGDAAGWTAALVPPVSRFAVEEEQARIPAPFERLLRRWIAVWGGEDPRSLWLAAIAITAEQPVRAGDGRLRTSAAALIRSLGATLEDGDSQRRRGPADVSTPTSGRRRATRVDAALEGRDMPTALPRNHRSAVSAPPDVPAAEIDPAPGGAPGRVVSALPDQVPHMSAEVWRRTAAGGLLFLLQPLRHLGVARALAEDSDIPRDLALQILASIARRLRVAADDPMWSVLGNENADAPRATTDRTVDPWVAAVRRWCRRHTAVTLRGIVRRDGFMSSTDTHVDVRFDPLLVDVRLRRAGLDLDPGWTPWFGRVVRFHYQRQELHG